MKVFKIIQPMQLLVLVLALLGFGIAQAHHPIHAKFDPAGQLHLDGIVTKVDWRNPHIHVFINVREM